MSNWRIPQLFVGRGPLGAVTRCVLLLAATLGLAATSGNARNASAELLAFGGRIIAADSGSLEGVHVVAVDARGTYEALVDSSGVFVGAFAAAPVGRVTLRVFSDSTAPRYHTSVITLGAGVPAMPARIVLVPRSWRIRGGAFDGREVRTDPVRATTRYADGMGYWRLTRRGYLAGRAVSWSTDSLPVRVAFRHERGDSYISADDSVRFWERRARSSASSDGASFGRRRTKRSRREGMASSSRWIGGCRQLARRSSRTIRAVASMKRS